MPGGDRSLAEFVDALEAATAAGAFPSDTAVDGKSAARGICTALSRSA